MKRIYFLFFFFIFLLPVHGELENKGPFYLRNLDWEVKGITRPRVLEKKLKINRRETWDSRQDFDIWIKNIEQMLINERVLDSAEIEYTIVPEERDERGMFPVDIYIYIKDTWNLIVLPKPQYETGKGLDLSLRLREYNFLGLLQPLRINFGYAIEDKALHALRFSEGSWYADIETSIPIHLAGHIWDLDLKLELAWTDDQVFQFNNENSLTWLHDFKFGTLGIGFKENFLLNEENGKAYIEETGKYFDGWYTRSAMHISYTFDFTGPAFLKTPITHKSSAELSYAYRTDLCDIGEERRGLLLTFSDSLSSGRVDWKGNFREGSSAELSFTLPYNIYSTLFSPYISLNYSLYHSFNTFFAFSTRLLGFYRFNDLNYDSADYMRGLVSLASAQALFTNTDFVLKLFSFRPHIYTGKDKYRLFAFETHLSIFFDFALTKGLAKSEGENFAHWHAGIGTELLLYPEFFRSLFLRLSLGWNLMDTKNSPEVFIGLGHHY